VADGHDCTVTATVGGTVYPCRSHEDGKHHFAFRWPDKCGTPWCRLPDGHPAGVHDIPPGRPELRDGEGRLLVRKAAAVARIEDQEGQWVTG